MFTRNSEITKDQAQANMNTETARITAAIRTDKDANNGLSVTQRSKPTNWQYQNSNFGMGI